MHVAIATPMYGGNCKGIYLDGILNLTFALVQKGHQVSFLKIYNESLITRARNNLVKDFLKSNADVLLFIDSDQGFDSAGVIKMIETDKDIIGAIVPMKNINWENVRKAVENGKDNLIEYSGFFNINLPPGENTFSLAEPVEVENVGTGLMCIKRHVFEEMKDSCKTYAFNTSTGRFDFDDVVHEFFTTEVVDPGILLSEDYYFCRKWKEMGGKVYVAPWVRVTHAGEYIFEGSFISEVMMNATKIETVEPEKTTPVPPRVKQRSKKK
jgi:hypothetical protein